MFRVYQGFRVLLASPAASSSSSGPSSSSSGPSSASVATKFYSAATKSASSKVAKKTPKKPATSKPKTKSPAAPRTQARPNGITKATPVSPALGRFLGAEQASRTEAVKQIWSYIKSQNLQNPTNKKEIFCDEKLKTIFDGKEKIGFLEIGKMLTPHFVKNT